LRAPPRWSGGLIFDAIVSAAACARRPPIAALRPQGGTAGLPRELGRRPCGMPSYAPRKAHGRKVIARRGRRLDTVSLATLGDMT